MCGRSYTVFFTFILLYFYSNDVDLNTSILWKILINIYVSVSCPSTSNFTDVVGHEDFLNLPPSKLLELVSSDALNVPREEDVFTAVLNWFNHQSDDRKEGFQMVGTERMGHWSCDQ